MAKFSDHKHESCIYLQIMQIWVKVEQNHSLSQIILLKYFK